MKNSKLTAILALLLLLIISILLLGNNLNIILRTADGFDNNSKIYYYLIDRAYSIISNNPEKKNTICESLEKGKYKENADLRIRILGVAGCSKAASSMLDIYAEYQEEQNHFSTLFYIIKSLGIIDNHEIIPILEGFLKQHDKCCIQIPKSSIARSLYLSTGEIYEYIGKSGQKTTIPLRDELKHARQVIVKSSGRPRTLEEMISLDKLFRKPQ